MIIWLVAFYYLYIVIPSLNHNISYGVCRVCVHTSQRKGFSPECCSECTFKDMLRLKDFPQVSQVNGMSFVWARDRQKTYCIRHKYVSLEYFVAIKTFEKISWWCLRFKYSLGQCWSVSVHVYYTYRPCAYGHGPWCRISSHKSHRQISSLQIHGQS